LLLIFGMNKYFLCIFFKSIVLQNNGSVASNQSLSLQRAECVFDFLVKNGIDSKRLVYQGKGESEPLVENNTEQNKAKNRRVEVKF
jgi:outer membrane protein OmpA-like peptidoglycan-associated protein